MAAEDNESKARDRLTAELKWEIDWQWRWEKKYRRLYYCATLMSWLAGFMVTVISVYQLWSGDSIQKWTIAANALLSVLSVSLPLLSNTFKFQQRQEVYDRMARVYTLLNTKLEMGIMSVEDALREFELIHLQPTEKVIRNTP